MKLRWPPFLILMVVSTIWGLTWIAIKIGLSEIPPLFFAATRFIFAGLLLGAIFFRKIDWRQLRANASKLVVISLLLTTFCYGPLFWGMQHTPSGLAAIVNLSLLPIGLLAFGVMLRVETVTVQQSFGIALGVAGLALMFSPELDRESGARAAGVGAIVVGTFSACLGSALTRRWLNNIDAIGLGASITFLGGVGLGALSALMEPLSVQTVQSLLIPKSFVSWLFLVVGGSLVAFTLYLHLLKVWGPLRSGLYAFISPIVALVAGFVALQERLEPIQLIAAAILIAAAALVTVRRRSRPAPCADKIAAPSDCVQS